MQRSPQSKNKVPPPPHFQKQSYPKQYQPTYTSPPPPIVSSDRKIQIIDDADEIKKQNGSSQIRSSISDESSIRRSSIIRSSVQQYIQPSRSSIIEDDTRSIAAKVLNFPLSVLSIIRNLTFILFSLIKNVIGTVLLFIKQALFKIWKITNNLWRNNDLFFLIFVLSYICILLYRPDILQYPYIFYSYIRKYLTQG